MTPVQNFEVCPEFVETERTHVCHDQDWEFPNPFVLQCEGEMMTVNKIVTSVGTQNNRKASCFEIVSSRMAVLLLPTPALDFDFTHSDRHLRWRQVCYWDGLEVIARADGHRIGVQGDNNDATLGTRSFDLDQMLADLPVLQCD